MNKSVINKIPKYDAFLSRCKDNVSGEDNDFFEKYYHLYEYTDDLVVLEDNPIYPGLINYVKTGILSEEEMIEALLH